MAYDSKNPDDPKNLEKASAADMADTAHDLHATRARNTAGTREPTSVKNAVTPEVRELREVHDTREHGEPREPRVADARTGGADVMPGTPMGASIGAGAGAGAGAGTGAGIGTGARTDTARGSEPRLLPEGESDQLALRLQKALHHFVDGPRRSVEEAAGVLEEATERLTHALAERPRTLRAGWDNGGDGAAPADTERLRVALQSYREVTERLLRV
ncbi:hypothetical protein [Streptomyces sp. NRRL F-5135]|uniref:hypothetical protein n=1 Tax=Streptomyces sp. NRRL F-5135 TaxID=1463858 RepID=UPI0006914C23|nr:hypothetical protein [Streptomyces sp. NRRL F-5135]